MYLPAESMGDEFYLTNGDKISGTIVEETGEALVINTQAMGEITIKKAFLKGPEDDESDKPSDEETVQWQRKASFGYSQSGGNTENNEFSGEISFNRKSEGDEWTGKLTGYYSSTNDTVDAKKFYSMLRYAYSFGESLKWYQFFKLEGDQDRFSNIDYRLVPSFGVGYWFSDKEDFKAMVEGAVGYEYTNYRDATDSEGELILVPRGFLEKTILGKLKFSEDVTVYPSLENTGQYRLHSETALHHPINDVLSWKLSFINDFDSSPKGDTKKNDHRLVSSIDVNF